MRLLAGMGLVMVLLLGGCAYMGQAKHVICGDDAATAAAYAERAAQAAEALAFLEILPLTPEVAAAIQAAKAALAVYARIRDGFCASSEEVAEAEKAQSQVLTVARRYGYRR